MPLAVSFVVAACKAMPLTTNPSSVYQQQPSILTKRQYFYNNHQPDKLFYSIKISLPYFGHKFAVIYKININ
jgi:hypothetical protein